MFQKLFLLYNIGIYNCIKVTEKLPDLYQLPGYENPAEFSDETHMKLVLDDIKNFTKIGDYKPKKYHELNHSDPNVGLEIT